MILETMASCHGIPKMEKNFQIGNMYQTKRPLTVVTPPLRSLHILQINSNHMPCILLFGLGHSSKNRKYRNMKRIINSSCLLICDLLFEVAGRPAGPEDQMGNEEEKFLLMISLKMIYGSFSQLHNKCQIGRNSE